MYNNEKTFWVFVILSSTLVVFGQGSVKQSAPGAITAEAAVVARAKEPPSDPFAIPRLCLNDRPACGAACLAGNAYACERIAEMLFRNAGNPKEFANAAVAYQAACDNGGDYFCMSAARAFAYQNNCRRHDYATALAFIDASCRAGAGYACNLAKKNRAEGWPPCNEKGSPSLSPPVECPQQNALNPKESSVQPRFDYQISQPPVLIASTDPIYPEPMRQAGKQGQVVIGLRISEQGEVEDARLLFFTDQGFIESAMTAVKKRKYTGALNCSRPVKTYKIVTIIYKLH